MVEIAGVTVVSEVEPIVIVVLFIFASVIPYPLIVVGLDVREAKVWEWLVSVFKDTLALPSIDTLPVTEPVKVRVLEFAHFEDVEADPAISAFVAWATSLIVTFVSLPSDQVNIRSAPDPDISTTADFP